MASARNDLARYIAEQKSADRQKLAKEVAAYLLTTKQIGQLESLLRDVKAVREADGIIEAEVVSAHPVDKATVSQIETVLKVHRKGAKKVFIETSQDPSVVGGLNIRLAHEQLNMTVRAKLDTFKRLTTKGA